MTRGEMMEERRSLGRLAREPLYNTSAVVRMTGVPADTIRAWERRYNFPLPFRTADNQRLYSDQDVGVISWLRDRTDEGMTISRAIQRLRLEAPAVFAAGSSATSVSEPPADSRDEAERLRRRFLEAVASFDTQAAEAVLDDAIARYSVEAFCERMVEPVLIEIGERWSRSEISVAVEHFASGVIARRLAALFAVVSQVEGRGTIVVACPAGEDHEIGLLVLAILLSRRGWQIVYLGANVPAADLVRAVTEIEPDLVCLSAASPAVVTEVVGIVSRLRAEVPVPPPVALGGSAVTSGLSVLRDAGIVPISDGGVDAVQQIVALLDDI
jgi:methanogenic corrinoid protein MtbC1